MDNEFLLLNRGDLRDSTGTSNNRARGGTALEEVRATASSTACIVFSDSILSALRVYS